MSSFSEAALEKKLADLNNSQQSIQTLSLWLIHHRKHHGTIVKVWYKELLKAKPDSRKLTFLYLANDVIQNSKKKGPEFGKEFGAYMKKVLDHIGKLKLDDKTCHGINRLLQIWEERGVYDESHISEFKRSWMKYMPDSQSENEPPIKKHKSERKEKKEKLKDPSSDDIKQTKPTKNPKDSPVVQLRSPSNGPPDANSLIKALQPSLPLLSALNDNEYLFVTYMQDLENSASSDAAIRQKIAKLPPEVSDVSLLSKLQDRASAEKLIKQVNEALNMLVDYNNRLSTELEDRKHAARMLQDFIQSQKTMLAQTEDKLEEYRQRLEKVYQVRQELRAHLQSLPDLTKLPDVTGGLRPLPSAGDLFSLS